MSIAIAGLLVHEPILHSAASTSGVRASGARDVLYGGGCQAKNGGDRNCACPQVLGYLVVQMGARRKCAVPCL
jgi:hypothetical protein